MKKTLFATISIILMLFAFVACDGSNPGPTGGDVTESEANTLAGNYLGSINFSQLIVDAFDDTVTTIDVASLSKDGFTIEIDKYAGKALSKTTATTPEDKAAATDDSATGTDDTESEEETVTISEITSGTIEFTFTTANSKTTYTAKTAADDPIVFKDAPEGADLAFDITGEATITFTRVGTNGAISNLASESTVKIGAPDATKSTISVGGTSVDYDDIKESAKGGFDQTATAPVADDEEEGGEITVPSFSADDAKATAAKIFAALSKDNLKKDLMAGLKGINDNTDSVKNVTLDDFEVLYRGSKNETLTAIFKDLFAEDASKNLLTTWPKDVNPKDISNITIKLTVSFKDYQNAFKEASGVYSIVSGKVTVSLVPGFADLTTTSMKGIYTVKTETPVVVSTADGNYSITLDKLASEFNIDGSNSDLKVTNEKDASPVISISDYNGKSQTLDWPSLTTVIDAIDKGTGYAEETAEQIDAEYFYQHFGTNKFLNALYDVFNPSADSAEIGDSLTITNKETLALDDNGTSLTLNVHFDNYVYHFTGGSQQVTGDVTFVFTGTKNDTTFRATSFTVSSEELTLSDNLKNRPGAKATIGSAEKPMNGTIGDDNATQSDNSQSQDKGITFTVGEDSKITDMTSYKKNYSAYLNEFVLKETGLQGIEITLDK